MLLFWHFCHSIDLNLTVHERTKTMNISSIKQIKGSFFFEMAYASEISHVDEALGVHVASTAVCVPVKTLK